MAHTTLPAAHSDADAVLAQQVGRRLQLRELHVFWTLPPARPARPAKPEKGEAAGLTGAFAAIGALLERIGERLAQVHGVRQNP
jgi:hypothetical protein